MTSTILNKKYYYILFAIMIFGIFIRFYRLDFHSYWYDEGGSVSYANNEFKTALLSDLNHPPMYRLLLHFWGKFFGYGTLSMRLPSALLGAFCLLIFYLILKQLSENYAAVLIGTLIFSISPFQIYLSQEVRNYMLFQTFTLLSLFYFLKILKGDSIKYWVLFGIFSLLNFYTFYLSAFIILSFSLYLIFFARGKFYRFLFTMIIDFILYIPWIIYFLGNQSQSTARPYLTQVLLRFFYIPFSFSLGYSGIVLDYYDKLNMTKALKDEIPLLFLTALAFGIPFALGIFKTFDNKKLSYLLALYFFVPIIVLVIIFPVLPLLVERYLIFLFPIFVIYLTAGIAKIRIRWMRYLFISAIVILELYSACNYFFNQKYGKEQYKEAAQYILDKDKDERCLIFFHKPEIARTFLLYYKDEAIFYGIPEKNIYAKNKSLIDLKEVTITNSVISTSKARQYKIVPEGSENLPFFSDLWKGYKHVFLVLGENYDTQFLYRDFLNTRFKLIDEKLFPKMNGVFVYEYMVN